MVYRRKTPDLFDARQYEKDVLGLPDGVTEQNLDDECLREAQALGIEALPPYEDCKEAVVRPCGSTATASLTSPRSASIDSRYSSSTGIISNLSGTSREHRNSHAFSLSFRNPSRSSVNTRYDAEADDASISSSIRSRSSVSLSPTSRRSSISLSQSQSYPSPRKPFSVRRSINRLSKLRKSSQSEDNSPLTSCDFCNAGGASDDKIYQLNCDHCLCMDHFQNLLVQCSRKGGIPKCCGRRIPPTIIHAVSYDFHQTTVCLASRPASSSTNVSSASQTPGRTGLEQERSITQAPPKIPELALNIPSTSGHAIKNLELAMAVQSFRTLRIHQFDQRDKFINFHGKTMVALVAEQTSSRRERMFQQRREAQEMKESHPHTLAKLEDQHVKAELDLRETHSQERRNCLTAIRHMEGYCCSHDPEGSGRNVTQQDMKGLERQYWIRDNMDHRHESAINVLRQQQALQYRIKAKKQEQQLTELDKRHKSESGELGKLFEEEIRNLDEIFNWQRRRLIRRWGVTDEIWRRRHDSNEHNHVPYPIAPLDWPPETSSGALQSYTIS